MQAPFGAASDIGRKRPLNEDSYIADGDLGLFLVADGMGGHAAGEVASKVVAEAVREFIVETRDDRDKTWPCPIDPNLSYAANRLRAAILVANRTLSQRVQEDENLRGMATTLSAVLLTNSHAVVSNVGDCRAYLVRNKSLSQITVDHSWVAEQVRAGLLTKDAARAHPWRSMVTRAVSGTPDLLVDVIEMKMDEGDQLLLCSDGLYGLVSDDEMSKVIATHDGEPDAACRGLVEVANSRGGPDNITALLIRVA
jgi:serine/threonine protein phosphatase PrpC